MLTLLAAGFISGIISGMGIGGGTILIPALTFFANLDQHQAQGVNLMYFLPTATIALISHKKNGNIETKPLKMLVLWGLIGVAAGSLIAVNMRSESLRKLFGVFLFFMGASELLKADILKKRDNKNRDNKEAKQDMDATAFSELKEKFARTDTEGKIKIYTTAQGLSTEQYKELLALYPYGELYKLEEALG